MTAVGFFSETLRSQCFVVNRFLRILSVVISKVIFNPKKRRRKLFTSEKKMSKPQRKIHIFNCDHVYELRVVADFLNATNQKHDFDFLVEEHYFSLPQISELSEKIIPELQMDFAVFVVHAHESRLSINEDDCGYTTVYRALLQATGGNVIIIIGGDDSYKDEDEEDNEFISRWARRKIYLQFKEEFMDGRKSFIFSWNKKHREIHEKALLHFFDPSKKGEKFEYQPPTKRKPPPKPTMPQPVRPSELEASSRPYSSLPAEGPYTGERIQSTKPDVPVESRSHRISDQGARPKEKRSSNTETKDLVILGCSVSEGSMQAVMQEIKKIGPHLNLKKEPPVKNLSPAEIKQYLERNWLKFCVLVMDAESVQDAYENLPKRRDVYEDLLKTAVNKAAEKVIIFVCDDLPLEQQDEAIVHQAIDSIVKERNKGFIAWLKKGRLTLDSDVLAQILKSESNTAQKMPQSGAEGQEQTNDRFVNLKAKIVKGTTANEMLMLKTRVHNGLVSLEKGDVEYTRPNWKVPAYITESLYRDYWATPNGELCVFSDEKGNVR